MTRFDHLEAHVADVSRYCKFLAAIFEGGGFEVISPNGTSMYTSPEGINIEVKKKIISDAPAMSGFCNPCIRHPEPKALLAKLNLHIESEESAHLEKVYFFKDHEGIAWHIKNLPE
jgi:hypothetical protein